jgi:hypothetical protein
LRASEREEERGEGGCGGGSEGTPLSKRETDANQRGARLVLARAFDADRRARGVGSGQRCKIGRGGRVGCVAGGARVGGGGSSKGVGAGRGGQTRRVGSCRPAVPPPCVCGAASVLKPHLSPLPPPPSDPVQAHQKARDHFFSIYNNERPGSERGGGAGKSGRPRGGGPKKTAPPLTTLPPPTSPSPQSSLLTRSTTKRTRCRTASRSSGRTTRRSRA